MRVVSYTDTQEHSRAGKTQLHFQMTWKCFKSELKLNAESSVIGNRNVAQYALAMTVFRLLTHCWSTVFFTILWRTTRLDLFVLWSAGALHALQIEITSSHNLAVQGDQVDFVCRVTGAAPGDLIYYTKQVARAGEATVTVYNYRHYFLASFKFRI